MSVPPVEKYPYEFTGNWDKFNYNYDVIISKDKLYDSLNIKKYY